MTFQSIQKEAFNLTEKEIKRLRFDVLRNYKDSMKRTQALLDDVYEKRLNNIDPDNYYNLLYKENRLTQLYSDIEKIYLSNAKTINATIAETSELSFINQYYRQQYIIDWYLPMIGSSLDFAFVDNLAVEMSVYGTESKWRELRKLKGSRDPRVKKLRPLRIQGDRPTLINLLRKNDTKKLRLIKDTITQGLITGMSNRDMSRIISKKYSQFERSAERIIRTETHRNMNGGQYLANENLKEQGIDSKRMIVSTLDIRARKQSSKVDGRMENDEGFFKYPRGKMVKFPGNSGVPEWDINDRETTIQVINGIKPKARIGTNPITGELEVTDFRSFKDWMNKYDIKYNKSGKIVKKSD